MSITDRTIDITTDITTDRTIDRTTDITTDRTTDRTTDITIDRTIDRTDQVVINFGIISNNLNNILAYQNLILTFLSSDNYIKSLGNIFQLILDLTFLNFNTNIISYLSNVEKHLLVIDLWLKKSIFNFENICEGEVTIDTYINLTFDNLTENINWLIHETKTNIISNKLLAFENYIKAIEQFNIILKNHAIIKEYIISVRVILNKSTVYIKNASNMWYNYNVYIQKTKNTITDNTNTNTNTNIKTENKKRKLELSKSELASDFESSKLIKKTTDFDTS
jgi:hypothetical protein